MPSSYGPHYVTDLVLGKSKFSYFYLHVYRVRTGPVKPGKSWNFIMTFSRTGKFWKSVKLN